ncbi:MAG: hypothetical protein AAB368_00695, partial [bacterium]
GSSLSTPSFVSMGQWFSVTLSVTNGGGAETRNVLPALTPVPGGRVVVVTGPSPTGPVTLAPGSATVFTWTYSATGSGGVTFNGSASGTTCADTLVTAGSGKVTTIQTPAAPVAALVAFPSPRDAGQTFLVTLTVTNAGQADLDGLDVAPFRLAPPGVATQTAGPTPSLSVTLAGGASLTFTWTFTGFSPGTVVRSTTPSGTDANSGKVVRVLVSSNPEVIQSPAALAVTGRAVPVTVPCVGEPFLLVVTVSNTGQTAAMGVTIADPLGAGSGSAAPTAGPDPVGAVTLAGGQSQVYTWTATGSAPGAVAFTATATGTDANTLAPVSSGPAPSGTVTISAVPGVLDTAVSAPAAASGGQWITVTVTFTNTGGSDLQGVSAVLGVSAGSGSFVAGPVPAGTVMLPVGSARTVSWTFSLDGAGTVAFSATASGLKCGATPVSAWGGGTTTGVAPAALTVAFALSPTRLVAGEWLTVTLYVTNAGGAAALNVTPSLAPVGPAVTLSGGPVPAVVSPLAPAGIAAFVWTWSTAGAGILSFLGGASGSDANSGAIVMIANAPSPSATVLGPAALAATGLVLTPSPAAEDALVTAILTLRNTGGTDARVTSTAVAEAESDPAVLGPRSELFPGVALVIPAGGTRTISWTYTAGACGTVAVTAAVGAVDVVTGKVLPTAQAASAFLTVIGVPAALMLTATPTSAPAGSPVTLIALLTDACGQPASGQVLAFAVSGGGGSVVPFAVTTNTTGEARATLTLGLEPGPNTANVGLAPPVLSATALVVSSPDPLALAAPGAALSGNVFSPAQGETVVARVYPRGGRDAEVRVYTASGRLVRLLPDRRALGAGQFLVTWDGRDEGGALVARGVYLIRISGGADAILKLVVR